ncbi:MAG: S41 family peptidase [Treponema sp.]|nr:S41 family peptidase [Treponema sp.]
MKKIILGILVGLMVMNMFCFGKETKKEKVAYKKLSFNMENFVENLTPVQMERDIDMLEYYIKNCYVNYDLIEKGKYFDFDAALSRLREECSQSTGMQRKEFTECIGRNLYGWPDSHVGLSLFYRSAPPFQMPVLSHFDYYSTGIVVKKAGNGYTVVSSEEPSVLKGWVYQSEGHDLFPLYTAGKTEQLFRIGTLSDKQTAQMQLVFSDADNVKKTETVPVSMAPLRNIPASASPLTIQQTDSQAYIRLTTLDDLVNQDPAVQKSLDSFVAYASEAKKKSLLVIDVRGNGGGDDDYVFRFFSGLCGNKIESNIGETDLWSPGIVQSWQFMQDYFLSDKKNIPDAMVYEIKKIQKIAKKMKKKPVRYYEINGKMKKRDIKKLLEGYKGKIILIMDRITASSAETFVELLKGAGNVVILGENSCGLIATGNRFLYFLPYSKCCINLPCSRHAAACSLPHGLDDGMGYSPDYWVSSDEELYGDLRGMGVDPVLLEKIKDE